MTTETTDRERSLSGFWRHDRSDDRVRELVSVLQGADNLIGLMGGDIAVTWTGAGSRTDFDRHLVALDYGPLLGMACPYHGSRVDEVIGYAAHEGGHCLWSAEGKYQVIERYVRTAWTRMPSAFQAAFTASN
ncbi:hypothetical protein LCGC14_2371580, partial [marine sediment metagenome]